MKHLLFTASTLAFAIAGTQGQAQSISSTGFTPYGYISLNAFGANNGGSPDTYLNVDAGFHWNFADNFGLDGSVVGVATDSGNNHAVYLAFTYDFDAVRLSVGAPRAAFDQYGRLRFQDSMPILGFSASPLTASIVTYLDLSASSTSDHSFGVRIDGQTNGGLEYAVSAHGFSDMPDAAAISGSLRYSFGEGVELAAGLEYGFSPSGDDIKKAKVGLTKDFGRYQLGIMGTVVDNFSSSTISMAELWGAYQVNDKFEVGASYVAQSNNSDLITLDASYEIYPNTKLKAALSRPTDGSNTTLYNVGLRYEF